MQVLRLRADALTNMLDDEPLPQGMASSSALSLFKYNAAAPTTTTPGSFSATHSTELRTDAHVDKGVITLVVAAQPGLQIQTVREACISIYIVGF